MEYESNPTLDLPLSQLLSGITCPQCHASLVTLDINPEEPLRCVECRSLFYRSGKQPQVRFSVKAILSLILALISPLGSFLTAIPAIVLGLLAVRDINRNSQLKGMPLAVSGITFGMLFSLLCGGFLLSVLLTLSSMDKMLDPATIMSRASSRFEFKLPPGVGPSSVQNLMGNEEFQFNGQKPATHIMAIYYPDTAFLKSEIQLQNTRLNIHGKLIDQQELVTKIGAVVKQTLDTNGSWPLRRYVALFESDSGYLIVVVSVRDSQEVKNQPLTDEQVIRFLESIKLVE
jgi:hypothetical protein